MVFYFLTMFPCKIQVLTLLLPYYSYAQKTCCWRTMVTLPVPMPEGEVYDYGGIIAAGFQSHLINPLNLQLC